MIELKYCLNGTCYDTELEAWKAYAEQLESCSLVADGHVTKDEQDKALKGFNYWCYRMPDDLAMGLTLAAFLGSRRKDRPA